jgi:iron complex transport system substrate-binding protein
MFGDVLRVAEAADCADEANRYLSGLQNRVRTVREATEGLPANRRPRVACIEWIQPLMVAANWTPELVTLAGGEYYPLAPGHSTYGSWDDLRAFDPEVLVISPCGFDLPRTLSEAEILSEVPQFAAIAAVRGGQVWCVDGNAYLNRSGPRLVDSLEILGHLLHPARIPRPAWLQGQALPWQQWTLC